MGGAGGALLKSLLVFFLGGLASLYVFVLLPTTGPLEDPGLSVILRWTGGGTTTSVSVQRKEGSGGLVVSAGGFGNTNTAILYDDMLVGLGYAHAHDRLVQMRLLRAVSRGELSAFVGTTEVTKRIDRVLRHQGFARNVEAHFRKNPGVFELCERYSAGVNAFVTGAGEFSPSGQERVTVRAFQANAPESPLSDTALPIELRIFGNGTREALWTPSDTLVLARLTMWSGLAECQEIGEHFVIDALASPGNIGRDLIATLFPGKLDGLDEELLEALRQVDFSKSSHPMELPSFVPSFKASNNFAVSSAKSAKGLGALLGSDPHLDVLQTPAVWYEVELRGWQGSSACPAADREDGQVQARENYAFGISFPGLPAIIMGRTNWLAWSQTHGFLDHMDYFVEHVNGSKYRIDDEWFDLNIHVDVVGGEKFTTFETREGHTLELDVMRSDHSEFLPEGFYLSKDNSHDSHGGAKTQMRFFELASCARTVQDAVDLASEMEAAMNFVTADTEGDIGYQQTGALPVRAHSGLFPVPGFRGEKLWQGMASPSSLSRQLHPESGIIVTANGFHPPSAGTPGINLHMGEDRVNRIAAILASPDAPSLETLKVAQTDVVSLQAKRYLVQLHRVLDQSISAAIALAKSKDVGSGSTTASTEWKDIIRRRASLLKNWDGDYSLESRAAVLFQHFYEELFRQALSPFLRDGADPSHIMRGAQRIFFHFWDDALLDPKSLFYTNGAHGSMEQLMISALARAFTVDPKSDLTLGESRSSYMTNMLFAGKLGAVGKILGLDFGPVSLVGSSTTPNQGGVFEMPNGKVVGVAPSWRMVTDLATDVVETTLPGGASGNVFSKWFTNRVRNWLDLVYEKQELLPRTEQ